jgi:hypothetical protein
VANNNLLFFPTTVSFSSAKPHIFYNNSGMPPPCCHMPGMPHLATTCQVCPTLLPHARYAPPCCHVRYAPTCCHVRYAPPCDHMPGMPHLAATCLWLITIYFLSPLLDFLQPNPVLPVITSLPPYLLPYTRPSFPCRLWLKTIYYLSPLLLILL